MCVSGEARRCRRGFRSSRRWLDALEEVAVGSRSGGECGECGEAFKDASGLEHVVVNHSSGRQWHIDDLAGDLGGSDFRQAEAR